MTNFFHTLFGYDKTFEPKVVIGHYDLISRFSDFPLYRVLRKFEDIIQKDIEC